MKNLPLLIGTIVVTLALVVLVAVFLSGSGSTGTSGQPVDQALLLRDARHSLGSETAKVVVVEFSDFQCPACGATAPLIKSVLAKYPEDARLVYRQYPLDSIHPYARLAAQASEVAGMSDQFWAYHDLLFERQGEWTTSNNRDTVISTLSDYAEEVGLNKEEFLGALEGAEVVGMVQADVAVGNELNIQATPTLYVNGVQTSAQDLDSVIETILSNQ